METFYLELQGTEIIGWSNAPNDGFVPVEIADIENIDLNEYRYIDGVLVKKSVTELAQLATEKEQQQLEQLKNEKRSEIEDYFQGVLLQGVEIAGKVYDCDETSRQRLTSAVTLAQTITQLGAAFQPIPWTLHDNSVHTIATLDELLQIAVAIGAHVQGLFAVRNNHKLAIAELDNIDDITNYDFSTGW